MKTLSDASSKPILSKHRRHALLALACVSIGLSACSSNSSSAQVDSDGHSVLQVAPPSMFSTRAVDPSLLIPTVTLNGDSVTMAENGDQWTGEATVAVNANATLVVEWVYSVGGLMLARAEKTASAIDTDITLNIIDTDYVTEGDDFDEDGDGLSNFAELNGDTDPYDDSDPGTVDPSVAPQVRVVARDGSTIIDGIVSEGTGLNFWDFATWGDVNGDDLRIDNLIVNSDPPYDTLQPDYQWAAVHDENYLTILVFGKSINQSADSSTGGVTATANGDSGDAGPMQYYQDDTLEIFFDGDFSRRNGYDTVDDLQILVPLVMGSEGAREANRSNATLTKRVARGASVKDDVIFNPRDESIFEFASCLCTGTNERVTWEIRINLEAANIPVGEVFGFELQINQDDDGGARDAKWAWSKPAREDGDINDDTDNTWRYANQMGKMLLTPFPDPS